MKRVGEESTHDLHIGGLGMFDGSQDRQHHAGWPAPDIATGDEITIRVLPAGEFDDPEGITGSPNKTIDDPDFGQLNYYMIRGMLIFHSKLDQFKRLTSIYVRMIQGQLKTNANM